MSPKHLVRVRVLLLLLKIKKRKLGDVDMLNKLKHNWGLLVNKEVGFKHIKNNNEIKYFKGTLNKVKVLKDKYNFIFDNNVLEINNDILLKLKIRKDNDIIWFIYDELNSDKISGIIGFSMFDTYGFPIEITEEILKEKGFLLDIEGYNVLKNLQKEKSQNTFKKTSAF